MPPDPPDPSERDRPEGAVRPPTHRRRSGAFDPQGAGHGTGRDGLLIRVTSEEPDPSRDRPDLAPTVSDIETKLAPLDVEVVGTPARATDTEGDLQRVVERYEELLASRDRDDRGPGELGETDGLLRTVRARLRAALDGHRG